MGTRPEASLASPSAKLYKEAKQIRKMLLRAGVVLMLTKLELTTAATCPCVSGSWKYRENSYSYCNNPNGAKTAWCPTALNDDGTYTSNLPFAYCEGEILTACDALKEPLSTTGYPCYFNTSRTDC